MMDGDKDDSSESNYQLLHKLYQRIKKLSKIGDSQNEENTSAEVKREMNELIDRSIEKIDATANVEICQSLRLLAMKITMFYERSKLLMSLGDERLSRETLITALSMINDFVSEEEIIFLAFRIINHYAYLLSKQEDFVTSRRILEFGETIYATAKKKGSLIKFFTSDDLFADEEITSAAPETSNKLERLVTSNLQMLSFVYNKQELHDKFAEYHHRVLQRQLEMNDEEVTMWSIKAARLASYFLSKNRFKEARNHLSAAIHVLHEYERDLKATEISDSKNEKLEDLRRKFADVAKCWVKYGLFLFSVSKTSMVTQFCGEPNQVLERLWAIPFKNIDKNVMSTSKKTSLEFDTSIERDLSCSVDIEDKNFTNDESRSMISRELPATLPKLLEEAQQTGSINRSRLNTEEYQGPYLIFGTLNLSEYENQVTATFVETTAQARALFLHTHGWLKRVKMFYSLNEHPMEYVNAILDLSELYRYLAFYEEDIESQYAVQKLRADALETLSTVLREIRPQCYMAVSVELLRELAEVQLEMMGLNLRRIYAAQQETDETVTSEATLQKMEALADMHTRLEQFGDNCSRYNIDDIERGHIPKNDESGNVEQLVL